MIKSTIVFSLMWLLGATTGYAQSISFEAAVNGSVAAHLVLQGSDVATTMFLVGRYPQQFREANPVLRPLVESPTAFGAVKMGLAVGSSWLFLKYRKAHPKAVFFSSLATNALYVYVVAHNTRLVQRFRVR